MSGLRKKGLVDVQEFRDTGCTLSPLCLNCPLPTCKYDLPPGEAWKLARMVRAQGAGGAAAMVGECE